jgi:outer membrane protein
MRNIHRMSLLAAALLASAGASAYEAGDWIVRGGAVMVAPNDDSSNLDLAGAQLAGTGVEVDDNTQLLLNVTWMANEHVGVELLAATPFEHSVDSKGLAGLGLGLSDVEVGSVKHLPPTLTVLWYPMESGAAFQPFVGAGINYTIFFQEDTSGAAQAALGARNLELDDSWGLAARAGFDYMLNDCWSLHAGVYYLGIDTKASLDTALGKVGVDVDINPWVYTVGLGYRF